MYPLTADLLNRVGALLPASRDYFRAVKKWYADTQLAFRAVRVLVGRSGAGAVVDLLVNGNQIAGGSISVHPQSKSLNWTVDARLLKEGRNRIAVTVDSRSEARLYLRQASAQQERGIGEHALDLSEYHPRSTVRFALDDPRESKFDGDAWCVPAGAHLAFLIDLEAPAPVAFSLTLLHEESNLGKVLKDIRKKVQEAREQLAEERDAARRNDPSLTEQIDDLDAYLELHKSQIEPAFLGGDDGTLEEVIARTANPDRIIREMQPPVKLTPAPPVRGVPVKLPPRASSNPRPRPLRPRDPSMRGNPLPATPAAAAGGLGIGPSILILLAGAALIFSGLGYAGWSLIKPLPIVFESPVEGQTIAAGAPLQVWISAEDLNGVKSLTLTAQGIDGATVIDPMQPLKYDFAPGTKKTLSKVFTLQIGALTGPEGTIILTATTVNGKGETATEQRRVKVGGSASDLCFELNPIDPKPLQTVDVTIRMVNAKPGSIIHCKVVGTDGYGAQHRLTVGDDGTVKFSVPGALKSGVIDMIDAEIEGTTIHRRVTYRF